MRPSTPRWLLYFPTERRLLKRLHEISILPLNQHCDDGLGATAEAFEDSAKLLINNAAEMSLPLQNTCLLPLQARY